MTKWAEMYGNLSHCLGSDHEISPVLQATKTREGAAVLVAQLLTRRDVEPQLISFTDWGDSC
jgi:hypothetical protein